MFLKISQISQESLFNKVAALRVCNFIKKASDTSAFLRTTILKNICERLLLNLFKNSEFCELFKNIYFKECLQTAGSKTPVREFLFLVTAWRPLTVLERDSSTLFQWILCNFQESFFEEHLPATTSRISRCFVIYCSFLQMSEVCVLKSVYLMKQW